MFFGNKSQYKTSWRPNHGKVPIPTKNDWAIIRARFANNAFVRMVEEDLMKNNWIDYDYFRGGVCVYEDRVETKRRTFFYRDYNLSNIDMESCWELGCWLLDFLPAGTLGTLRSIKRSFYSAGTTYYYETSGGHLGVGDTSSGGEMRIGYMVFQANTKDNSVRQNSMNW